MKSSSIHPSQTTCFRIRYVMALYNGQTSNSITKNMNIVGIIFAIFLLVQDLVESTVRSAKKNGSVLEEGIGRTVKITLLGLSHFRFANIFLIDFGKEIIHNSNYNIASIFVIIRLLYTDYFPFIIILVQGSPKNCHKI